MVREKEATRRSPYSERGERKHKIPVAVEEELMNRVRSEAEEKRITMSYLVSQILADHYQVRTDPIATLEKRVQRLEDHVFGISLYDASPKKVDKTIKITDTERSDILKQKALLDLTLADISIGINLPDHEVHAILTGDKNEIPVQAWKKLKELLGIK